MISRVPASDATNVPTDTVVTIGLDERVNPLTVNDSTFRLRVNSPSVIVDGTIAVPADGLSFTFTPDAPLDPSTVYRVDFLGAITDLVGIGLPAIDTLFTTAAAP